MSPKEEEDKEEEEEERRNYAKVFKFSLWPLFNDDNVEYM